MMPIFERELMITGLIKQRHLLSHLIAELNRKIDLKEDDCQLYYEISLRVEQNLRRLREIRKEGRNFPGDCCLPN